jgi:triosephosphate isomerase
MGFLRLLFSLFLFSTVVPNMSSSEDSDGRKLFVATNWKCSIESPSDADSLVESMNEKWATLDESVKDAIELSVHPPYVFLDRVRRGLDPSIAVGSQNVYDAAFPNKGNTAATTVNMISELGCQWILLGHSDRRNNLGEDDNLIAEKAALALNEGLGVVLTIGEKKEQRENGEAIAVLEKQLGTVASAIPADKETWKKVVLAYEPVWAVGE